PGARQHRCGRPGDPAAADDRRAHQAGGLQGRSYGRRRHALRGAIAQSRLMKRLAPLLITVLLAIYPLLVWQGVERVGAPTLLGLLLAALGLRAAVLARGRKQVRIAGFVLVVAGIAAAVTRTGDVEPL